MMPDVEEQRLRHFACEMHILAVRHSGKQQSDKICVQPVVTQPARERVRDFKPKRALAERRACDIRGEPD